MIILEFQESVWSLVSLLLFSFPELLRVTELF